MIRAQQKQKYYQALCERNVEYEGLFFVGVKTTGVFCHATCPARKPKYENCEFYRTAKEALVSGFRPCQRCQPLSPPNQMSPIVKQLVDAIEAHPEKRWTNKDLEALSIDVSTAQRQFKKRFGMTFIEYVRSRRMGMAMKQIRKGDSVVNTQIDSGYESGSGFRDAFSRIMGDAPVRAKQIIEIKATWIDTPIGPMVAMADDVGLYLLEFAERRGLEREVERLRTKCKAAIIPGDTKILQQIQHELADYFSGHCLTFKTPMHIGGSDFQKTVWRALCDIPVGETRSYADIAKAIGRPTAYRAVAQANGSNQLALIIPCHRVINSNGEIGGYGGGISRKEWLLQHERQS